MGTPITDFYRDKTLFITGASGFIGKVLLEKLLYSCSDLKKIYILIRSKKGNSIKARLNDIWESPVFSRLKKEQPDALHKIIPLEGDLVSDDLGLSISTIDQLHKEVNIVFHCAAGVRFEANLKEAVDQNTTATWRLINICREMNNLNCLIHLSTAFCNIEFDTVNEEVYDATENPHDIMHMVKWMKDDVLEAIENKLLRDHPNTYTYTKRLAECLIRDEYPKMPVAIARPSIVSPAWNEPLEGWVDSLNGPVGVMLAAGKGVIHTVNCNGECKVDLIPIDCVVNGLIVFAESVDRMKKTSSKVPVCNLSSGDLKDITWEKLMNLSKAAVRENPLDYPLWYPNANIHKNKHLHMLLAFFFHLIPAYLVDFLMILLRKKRFMVRLQNRIALGLNLLQFFTTRQWLFVNNVYKALMKNLTPDESLKFQMDLSAFDDEEYIKRCTLGVRLFCLKEKPEDIPKARRVNYAMYLLDRSVTMLFYGYIFWSIYKFLYQPILNFIL